MQVFVGGNPRSVPQRATLQVYLLFMYFYIAHMVQTHFSYSTTICFKHFLKYNNAVAVPSHASLYSQKTKRKRCVAFCLQTTLLLCYLHSLSRIFGKFEMHIEFRMDTFMVFLSLQKTFWARPSASVRRVRLTIHQQYGNPSWCPFACLLIIGTGYSYFICLHSMLLHSFLLNTFALP